MAGRRAAPGGTVSVARADSDAPPGHQQAGQG